MTEHISRKELKQDKIKETLEHGAEAVISHGQFAGILAAVILVLAVGYGTWAVARGNITTRLRADLIQACSARRTSRSRVWYR